jgi:hypothetical protein
MVARASRSKGTFPMNQPQSLADQLMSQLQGAPMEQMGQQLGASHEQIQSAVGAALPLLMGALGHNAAQPQGAADLLNALQRDHGNALPQGLGGLGGLLGSMLEGATKAEGGGLGAGGAILGNILGNGRQQTEARLGQATGLGDNAGKLLAMLAPMVMAFLANHAQSNNMDASALGQTLGREQAQARQQGGLAGGLLGSLLDQNGDGKLDAGDLLQLGASLLGGRR